MKCPVCGQAELLREARDVRCQVNGREVVVPGVVGDHCPACGEVLMGAEVADAFGREVEAARGDLGDGRT
jgi:HTH-type transcriptional regulator/antitoxin MqsA